MLPLWDSRGDAAAASWIFHGRRRRSCDIPWNGSRRRRGCLVGVGRVAATPRLPCGCGTGRGDAAAALWVWDGSRRRRGCLVEIPLDGSRRRRGCLVDQLCGQRRAGLCLNTLAGQARADEIPPVVRSRRAHLPGSTPAEPGLAHAALRAPRARAARSGAARIFRRGGSRRRRGCRVDIPWPSLASHEIGSTRRSVSRRTPRRSRLPVRGRRLDRPRQQILIPPTHLSP